MRYFYISLLILSLHAIQASIYSNLKKNILSLLDDANADKKNFGIQIPGPSKRYFQHKKKEDAKDKKAARKKASVLKSVRTHEKNLNIGRDIGLSQPMFKQGSSKLNENQNKIIGRHFFHMDPVLNELRNRRIEAKRRQGSGSSGSDVDMKFWMDEWDEHWLQKKFEALNSTQPRGDVVNMVAARPWGVPCGDPNQHDMPWGSCMLPMECDAEYRIYRGDYFCGRTSYVCCSLLLTNYDMYQGLDISFEGTDFSTDSNEKNHKGSQEEERKDRQRAKNKRKRERDKRKRQIRKSIRRIVSEIQRILNRAFRNGTAQRKRKTKELKKFIEIMKRQYRKDRKSVVNVHEFEMVKIDETLQAKLDKIQAMNEAYMSNDTFREIVVNGTVNKKKLLRFLRSHPELMKLFKHRRTGLNLNGMDLKPVNLELDTGKEEPALEMEEPELDEEPEPEKENPQALDYDLEYGMLYF